MSILITLIVYFCVFGLIYWLVTMLPLPAPVAKIVQVLFVIVAIIALLSLFLGGSTFPSLSLPR